MHVECNANICCRFINSLTPSHFHNFPSLRFGCGDFCAQNHFQWKPTSSSSSLFFFFSSRSSGLHIIYRSSACLCIYLYVLFNVKAFYINEPISHPTKPNASYQNQPNSILHMNSNWNSLPFYSWTNSSRLPSNAFRPFCMLLYTFVWNRHSHLIRFCRLFRGYIPLHSQIRNKYAHSHITRK